MKLPFAVYTAREGYQWISGLDAGIPRLEQFRRAIGKLPEFDFGDPLFCGAVNLGDTVVAYRFLKEKQGDSRGRDSLYLALTYFDKSVAVSIDFKELLGHELFVNPMREPPSSIEYDGGASSDSGPALDAMGDEIGLDSVGALYARLDDGSLKVVHVEGEQSCVVKYQPPVAEIEPCGSDEVTGEESVISKDEPCGTGRDRYRMQVVSIVLIVVILFGCYMLWRRAMTGEGGSNPEVGNIKPVASLTEDGGLDNE